MTDREATLAKSGLVQAEHKKKQGDCKEIPLEECKKKFMCKDGKVLTTEKLREMLNAQKLGTASMWTKEVNGSVLSLFS